MNNSEHTMTVAGWPITIRTIDNKQEPTIVDEELARRLSYERPRKIRDLIKRHADSGALGGMLPMRPTVERIEKRGAISGFEERKVMVYDLTEAQAYFIVAKSDTTTANALLREMIQVFILARQGLLTTDWGTHVVGPNPDPRTPSPMGTSWCHDIPSLGPHHYSP